MTIAKRIAGFGIVAAILVATSMPALAHHVMGGKTPSTLMQGLLSGFGHPVIGMDHLFFIIGVGLLAGMIGSRFPVPLAFIAGTLGGAVLHLMGLNIAFAEFAIAISVILMAVAVIVSVRLPALFAASLVAIAGIFHGYAYAESIFGAEPTPLYAYLAGFAVIQFVVAFAAASLYEFLLKRESSLAQAYARVAGGAMAGIALVALSNMAFGA
jgi:urease accessory protein